MRNMLDDDQYIKIDAIIAKLKVKLGIPSSSIEGGNRIWKKVAKTLVMDKVQHEK